MKRVLVAVAALLLSFATTAAAQQKPQAIKSGTVPRQLEAQVRKLWEAFKNKDKATLSALLDDGFRQFEEGLTGFGGKKTEVNGG
jgi:hypothetical protein